MKLHEVWLRDPIRDDAQVPQTHLSRAKGHELDVADGFVTLKGKAFARNRLVPLSNVTSLVAADPPTVSIAAPQVEHGSAV